MEKKRFLPLAVLGLTVAGVSAGCGNNPGSKTLYDELNHNFAEDGRNVTTLVIKASEPKAQTELMNNKGVNVRLGDHYSVQEGTIVGIIPEGQVIDKAVIFESDNGDKWAATQCVNPAIKLDEPFKSVVEQSENPSEAICYFDSQDFAQEVKSTSK